MGFESLAYVRDIEATFESIVKNIYINGRTGDILLTSDYCIALCDVNDDVYRG